MNTKVEFDSVKKVLFGNQVQSSVMNDAIATIVLNYIKATRNIAVSNCDEAVTVLSDIITELINRSSYKVDDEYFLRLVLGNTGYNNVISGDPVVLNVNRMSPESPKHTFRVSLFGVDADDREVSIDTILKDEVMVELDSDADSEETNPYVRIANGICEEVAPYVPDALKQNVSDKYIRALITAKHLYKRRD